MTRHSFPLFCFHCPLFVPSVFSLISPSGSLHYRFFCGTLKQQWRSNQKREQRTCFSRSDVTFWCTVLTSLGFFSSTQLCVYDPGNFRSLLSMSICLTILSSVLSYLMLFLKPHLSYSYHYVTISSYIL